MNEQEIKQLEELCKHNSCSIIKMIHCAKSGHPGGGLSAVEILTVLFDKCMKNFSSMDKFT